MCDEQGSCYHTHVYILLSKKKRWSACQKAFEHGHIETDVKGSPQECRDYLRKEGKHADKAETSVEGSFYEEGELPEYQLSGDRTYMLVQIDDMIESGMKPEEIMEKSLVFRQYESIIRKQFFTKRFRETPPLRDVKVIWHIGASGSGKSYTYVRLCEKYGADDVYFASDYANSCTALFDSYSAEHYLFLDEVKADSFKYGYLLQILQGYRTPIHARYANVYSLWTEIHITSVLTPHDVYEGMVGIDNRSKDSEYQLFRRITQYVFHWRTDDGVFHEYEISASEWKSYQDLVCRATGSDFVPIDDDAEVPFNN